MYSKITFSFWPKLYATEIFNSRHTKIKKTNIEKFHEIKYRRNFILLRYSKL